MGGEEIGLGHLVRCCCLAGQLRTAGFDIFGFWVNDITLFEQVKTVDVPDSAVFSDGRGCTPEWAIDGGQVDCLLVDQVADFSTNVLQLKARYPQLFTVALDPPVLDSQAYDLIVSLFAHGTERRVDFSPDRYLLGLEYALIRPQFARSGGPSPRARVDHVLVSCGGTDPSRLTLKIIRSLIEGEAGRQSWHLHIVIGPGFAHGDEVRRAAGELGPHTLYENVEDMAELMEGCDIGIISPGATLMEMCALGKSSITVAHNEQEARFARSFHVAGATQFLGVAVDLEAIDIAGALFALCEDNGERVRVAAQAKRLIDGKGGTRVARIIDERMSAISA
jgi:UDP-2,4-diacetamido-2,4,6-trideoxy-beta-L-altropyranose hydrolase